MELKLSTRFQIPDEVNEILTHLEIYGYAVVKEVLYKGEIEHSKNLFWKFIDQVVGTSSDSDESDDDDKISRSNPESWRFWPGDRYTGIIGGGNFCHSEFLWYLREHPRIREVFEYIWNTNDLLTSYDRGSTFRPWQQYNDSWKTRGGWWHIDQNSLKGPTRTGRVSIQSLITINDVTELTGGFAAIPGSHHFHEELSEQFAATQEVKLDHILLHPHENIHIATLPKLLISAKAGDMILWDSRLVHCNMPAITTGNPYVPEGELLRLVGYVCMQPRIAAPDGSALTKKLGLLCQIPTSHWAIEDIDKDVVRSIINQLDRVELVERGYSIFMTSSSEEKLRMCAFTVDEICLGREDFTALWQQLIDALFITR